MVDDGLGPVLPWSEGVTNMSESKPGPKGFFVEQGAAFRSEQEDKRRTEEAARKKSLEIDEAFRVAAETHYKPQFERFADDRQKEGFDASVTKGEGIFSPEVITAVDPMPEGDNFQGNVHLRVRSQVGRHLYEVVYLAVQEPVPLGMLAWRLDNEKYFVGPESRCVPFQVDQSTAARHFKLAVDAMQAG